MCTSTRRRRLGGTSPLPPQVVGSEDVATDIEPEYEDGAASPTTAIANVPPRDVLQRLQDAATLPVYAPTERDVLAARRRMRRCFQQLLATPGGLRAGAAQRAFMRTPRHLQQSHLGYELSYSGLNNMPLRSLLASAFVTAVPELNYTAPQVRRPRSGGPVRVGFVSSSLSTNHTQCRLLCPLINRLSRLPKLNVSAFVFTSDLADKDYGWGASEAALNMQLLPQGHSLVDARRKIVAAKPDVLIYNDISFSPTPYFLSLGRLARAQVLTLNNGDTSGVPTMDYFIDAAAHHCANDGASCGDASDALLAPLVAAVDDAADARTPSETSPPQFSERLLLLDASHAFMPHGALPALPAPPPAQPPAAPLRKHAMPVVSWS